MRTAMVLLSALACAVITGCGGSAPAITASAPAGPHGGPIVVLPGDQGYGEVLVESETTRKGAPPRLVAYFLLKDQSAPLSTLPTTVAVKLIQPGGESADYPLQPEPKAGDRFGAARFASKPVTNPTDQLVGELTVTLGGQTATQPFAGR